MLLTDVDLSELTALRRRLHRTPEVSGEERDTAAAVLEALHAAAPDRLLTGLGGHGVAAVFGGRALGPTVMIRCELDGLPIEEISDVPHRSAIPGRGHLCGHDGHMAILLALSRQLARKPPASGRVVLLFQPAEEDGSGAAAVIADPRFGEIAPDWAFALHNFPGLAVGTAAIRSGPVNCASRGLCITLSGKTSHASEPEAGVSPAPAVARLIETLPTLGPGGPVVPGYRLLTVTHARIGEPAFGIAPGRAELWVTLRTLLDEDMAALLADVEAAAGAAASAAKLDLAFTHHDVFAGCVNHPDATDVLRSALASEGIQFTEDRLPMRASEDFGRFGAGARSAMFFLGAGENHPALHNPDYDFPDDLIGPGARVFDRAIRNLLG